MMGKIRDWCVPTRRITSIVVHSEAGRYMTTGSPVGEEVLNGVYRKGKFLIFELKSGMLVCHNAMSGYWDTSDHPWTFDYVEGRRRSGDSDVRVSIHMANRDGDKTQILRFHDARKFGSLLFYPVKSFLEIPSLRVGPDALEVDEHHFRDNIRRRGGKKRLIKDVLMDQRAVSGVGNIYSVEALWWAKVRPDRPVIGLSVQELKEIWMGMRSVLFGALARDLNYDGLRIYRRHQCPTCSEMVQKIDIKGRSTYFCGKCQS